MALALMEKLQTDGLIQNYLYSEQNDQISFTYSNGVLGGISFHDFANTDGLPMN